MADDDKTDTDTDTAIVVRDPAPLAPARPDPTLASMVCLAVERGDAALLERLMVEWRREREDQRKMLFVAAMARFKASAPPVLDKDALVDFTNKAGVRTRYTHASLGSILAALTPHLSAQGLSIAWKPDQGKDEVAITCTVTHEGGHSESVTLRGPLDDSGNKNRIQQVGSTSSYLERYTLTAVLGVATGDLDDDGGGADPPVPPSAQKPAPQPAPKSTPPAKPTHTERAAKTIARFRPLGVLLSDLESPGGIGKRAEHWTDADMDALIPIYQTLAATPAEERSAAIRTTFRLSRQPGEDG